MALLILRESNNTTRYTSKRPNPRHRPCFATPRSGHRPHHDAAPKQFPSTAVGQHHDAAPGQRLGAVPGQHPGAAAEQYPGAASSQPCPAPDPPPLRIGPTTTQHRIRFNPRSASSPQHPSTASGPSQEPRNKESVRIATFLRLAIAASSSIANRGTKTQQKCHISSLKEPRRAPNRKKVAKIPSFLFLTMGPIAATGQIPRKRAEYHDQQPQNQKQERRPPCGRLQKTKSAVIYASWAPYCS